MFGKRTISIFLLLVVIVFPQKLFAFGPYTHIYIASTFVDTFLAEVNPMLFSLINQYSLQYFYGNIAADIIIAKNVSSYLFHCHNWGNIYRLFSSADSDEDRSFIFGYLTHLLADIVAHNYFIPLKYIQSFAKTFERHIYWEMKLDSAFSSDEKILNIMEEIINSKEIKRQDKFLKQFIIGTIIRNFTVNKKFFEQMLTINQLNKKNPLKLLRRKNKNPIPEEEVNTIISIAHQNIKRFFSNPEDNFVFELDPRGILAINIAKSIRKELKKLYAIKLLKEEKSREVMKTFEPFFRNVSLGYEVKIPNIAYISQYIEQEKKEEKSRKFFSSLFKKIGRKNNKKKKKK